MNLRNCPDGIELFEGKSGRGAEALRSKAHGAKLCRECHREAAGKSRGDQFFWIRAFAAFETRTQLVLSVG